VGTVIALKDENGNVLSSASRVANDEVKPAIASASGVGASFIDLWVVFSEKVVGSSWDPSAFLYTDRNNVTSSNKVTVVGRYQGDDRVFSFTLGSEFQSDVEVGWQLIVDLSLGVS